MEQIKSVGIKELKNDLSGYLRDVQRGVKILVTDRNRVVAELGEPKLKGEEKMIPARLPKVFLSPSPIKLPQGTSQSLIDQDRNEK